MAAHRVATRAGNDGRSGPVDSQLSPFLLEKESAVSNRGVCGVTFLGGILGGGINHIPNYDTLPLKVLGGNSSRRQQEVGGPDSMGATKYQSGQIS